MSVSKITTPVTENELIGKVNDLIAKSNNICAFTFTMYGETESSSVGTYDLVSYDATITPPSGFRYEPANYDYTLVMYPFTEYLTFDARSGYVDYNNNSIYVYFYGNKYRTRGNPSFVGLLIESEKSDTLVASYKKPIVMFPPNSVPTAGFFQATSGSTLNANGYYETTIGLARPADRGNATYPVMVAVLNDGHAANYANYATYTYNNGGVTFTLYTKSPSTTSNFYVCCIDADAQMIDYTNTIGSGSKVPTNGTENIASSATFTGADGTNAGSKGLVPAPTATDNDKFLKGDGTWGTHSGANSDLSNLTSTGQNIANWSSNVTNCITEIPQDIKLELDNGTLTLKAGSKVYAPNGFEQDGVTPKFDVLDITTDVTTSVTFSANVVIDVVFDRTTLSVIRLGGTSSNNNTSGTTPPTTGLFYNTSTNKIDYYSSGTISRTGSFPICIFTDSTSFEVFNGFGYIGSTIFALPGVKGLIPNGRNADGTPKSTEFTTNSVLTQTYTTSYNNYSLRLNATSINVTSMKYNEADNYNTNLDGAIIYPSVIIGNVSATSGTISNFETETAFHALGWSDSSTISGWAMPSTKYIELTLGASGSTYTAPANGYFVLIKQASAVGQYAAIYQSGNLAYSRPGAASTATTWFGLWLPVKKGNTVTVAYNLGGTTQEFNFVYAEGEN